MNNLKEIQTIVDIKIAELRQKARFAINEYDYHHKNDEFQILEQQMEILNQVVVTYTKFLNEMQKFNETLNDAKQMSAEFDQMLLESQPTTQQQVNEEYQQPLNDGQHETKTSKDLYQLSSTKKNKFKDTTSKKQLFPPASNR